MLPGRTVSPLGLIVAMGNLTALHGLVPPGRGSQKATKSAQGLLC
jgi:hypothetical protein